MDEKQRVPDKGASEGNSGTRTDPLSQAKFFNAIEYLVINDIKWIPINVCNGHTRPHLKRINSSDLSACVSLNVTEWLKNIKPRWRRSFMNQIINQILTRKPQT